jgi:hypothetical protein
MYADAVVSETLRLFPSVPANGRFANQDVTLPSGTFMKKGKLAIIPIMALGKYVCVYVCMYVCMYVCVLSVFPSLNTNDSMMSQIA